MAVSTNSTLIVDSSDFSQRLRAYLELTKPRILVMVLVTFALGFFLGSNGIINWSLFAMAMLGTAFVVAGSAALNMYYERDVDAMMKRTSRRALVAGTVSPAQALVFGSILILFGTALLIWQVNLLTAFLGLLSAFLYVVVYTPLKRVTSLNTLIGAIPGALPPLGGWTAVDGSFASQALLLFFILFAWQQPHFYAIAWMYREDYERGGLKMLPVVDPGGGQTLREIFIYALLLVPLSILPTLVGMTGVTYLVGAFALSGYYLYASMKMLKDPSMVNARALLRASIVYLPLLLALIVFDAVH